MTVATVELESLWNQERAKLVNYMRRRVGPEQAEDLVQDLFLRAWSAIVRGVGANVDARGWMYRCAHNLIIDSYRVRDRAPETCELDAPYFCDGDTTWGELLPSDAMLPDEVALQTETIGEVQFAIGRLCDDQREVIVRRMEGYELDEIATETGKSIGAVKALQSRGYTAIHSRLVKRFGYEGDRATRTNRSGAIEALLLREGPLTRREIHLRLGVHVNAVNGALYLYPDKFARVGTTVFMSNDTFLWGIVGIHDQAKDAA